MNNMDEEMPVLSPEVVVGAVLNLDGNASVPAAAGPGPMAIGEEYNPLEPAIQDGTGNRSHGNGNGSQLLGRRYCRCANRYYGEMIRCDNGICASAWFHYKCVGLSAENPPDLNAKWYCKKCRRGQDSTIGLSKQEYEDLEEEFEEEEEEEEEEQPVRAPRAPVRRRRRGDRDDDPDYVRVGMCPGWT